MSQVVYRNQSRPLPSSATTSVKNYLYVGESIGTVAYQVPLDGSPNKVVCLEPNTVGFIETTAILSQTNTTTGVLLGANYQKIVTRYQVSPTGVITLSSGAPTHGAVSTPITPANVPDNRLSTNVTVLGVNRSATNYYPHIIMQVIGGAGTNNWFIEAKVYTLPLKGT